jgi:cysteine desulfurase
MKFPIYLDHNATTPCDPKVLDAMLPWFSERFGNASSSHHPFGWVAEEAVEVAREQVSTLIGANPREIVFTSGATEALNLAIRGIMEATHHKGHHLITVETEHKAVLDTCNELQKKGIQVTYLPVKRDGVIDLGELEQAISPSTAMIIVMLANNETGVIQPIQEISTLAKKHGVLLLSDAAQAAGKISVKVKPMGVDLMALSAHKMYGPKGVGALYIRHSNPRINIVSQITGGGHEGGMRSGTLNVPGIVGFGQAAEIAQQQLEVDQKKIGQLRNYLEKGFLEIDGVHFNGNQDSRLPHVSHVSFEGVVGKELLIAINKELAVSSGSACSSITSQPSHVLKAMGISDGLAFSSLRFGLGRSTTEAQVEFAVQYVKSTVNSLRSKNRIHTID